MADALLPAASTAVPVAERSSPSADSVTGAVHETSPESASAQVNETVTSVLLQPCPFGANVEAALIVGAVASRLMTTLTGPADPPALDAAQK